MPITGVCLLVGKAGEEEAVLEDSSLPGLVKEPGPLLVDGLVGELLEQRDRRLRGRVLDVDRGPAAVTRDKENSSFRSFCSL